MKCSQCGRDQCPRLADVGAAMSVQESMHARQECIRYTVYRADRAQASAAMLAEGWLRLRREHSETPLPSWMRDCDIIAADALENAK